MVRPIRSHAPKATPSRKYDVFISWSGDAGSEVGEVLIDWLSKFLPGKRFFYSPDIERGADWRSRLLETLGSLNVGIILLTEEAVSSHWVLYEAGALAKNRNALIIPVILDIHASRIPGPLDIRNATFLLEPTKEAKCKKQFENMVATIQVKLGVTTRENKKIFDRTWHSFIGNVRRILANSAAARQKEDASVELLRHHLAQPSCKNSSLKQDIIRDLILTRAEPKLTNIEHGKIELQALDSVNYVAFNFLSIFRSLRDGDRYSAVAAMRFFSGNRMLGGVDKFIKESATARKNGAVIERYIIADASKISRNTPNDAFVELQKVIKKYSKELRSAGYKSGFEHTALLFPDSKSYKAALRNLKGFALVQRDTQYMAVVPENVKNSAGAKELGRMNIYFDCTPHDQANAVQVDKVREYLKRARQYTKSRSIKVVKLG